MKPFEKLTLQGQIRRMRSLAWKALDSYPLKIKKVSYLGWYTNLLFRIWTSEGRSLVLRVCAPGWRTDLDLQSEAAWLEALAGEADIRAPQPIINNSGKYLTYVEVLGVPGSRRCLLMSWIPGVPLGKQLNEKNLALMGELFARLHQFSAGYQPANMSTDRKLDKVLARDEEDVLFSETCFSALDPAHKHLLLQVRGIVEQAYANLYAQKDGLRVIHHDLWHDNIHISRARLYPLDFEDTAWGYPVQDLAMALQDLMNDVEPQLYEPYAAALRSGYESLSTWPETYEGQIDIFRAGRMLWVANFVAGFQNEHLDGFLSRIQPMLESFLETGKLRKIKPN